MRLYKKATTRIWAWPTTDRVIVAATTAALLAVGGSLLTVAAAADPKPLRPDDVAVFMRAKLDHASEVLEDAAEPPKDLVPNPSPRPGFTFKFGRTVSDGNGIRVFK